VPTTGQLPDAARAALVATALLRLGSDTKAARIFRESIRPTLDTPHAVDRAPQRLAAMLGLAGEALSDALRQARERASRALADTTRLGLHLRSCLDTNYPSLLSQIPDPPIVFWHSCDAGLLERPAVAVVGSRRAGPTGLETARRLARDLARAGVVVISGLARGIDAAAHAGALEAGGPTIAVLGSGVDVIYPREHRRLAQDIGQAGGLVSELPPGTPPLPHHFPLRNRLISGLSKAVVVVEASEKSGSLITARLALEQGRDVLAVPGNVVSGCHRGCHALIKDGARLVENVEDILDEIRWTSGDAGRNLASKSRQDNELLSSMRPGEPVSVDDLAARTGRPAAAILAELGGLEVDGLVARTGGGLFTRLD
jgi:DNA processing protein